jgi:hypothetical protein
MQGKVSLLGVSHRDAIGKEGAHGAGFIRLRLTLRNTTGDWGLSFRGETLASCGPRGSGPKKQERTEEACNARALPKGLDRHALDSLSKKSVFEADLDRGPFLLSGKKIPREGRRRQQLLASTGFF